MSGFGEWFNANKTKLAGFLTIAVAAIEVSPARDMIFKTPEAFALFVLVIGLVVSAIGVFNTKANTEAAVTKIAEKIVDKKEDKY